MRITAISDLHGNLPEIDECEVLCICGDILPNHFEDNVYRASMWLATDFRPWIENLPCDKVFIIAGNHDRLFYEVYKEALTLYDPKSKYDDELISYYIMNRLDLWQWHDKLQFLMDSQFTYKGLNFYGTPWVPNLPKWSFYRNSEGLKKSFDKIPENVDVLLTHTPPTFNKAGIVSQRGWNYMKDFGCIELNNAILEKKPKWVLSGHIHTGNHVPALVNEVTNVVNVSILDEDYRISYSPFTFEI